MADRSSDSSPDAGPASTQAGGPPTGGATANAPPQISLPKGGGAIRGMGEKFGVNPVTGTGSLTVPIAASPGRSGFGPQLSLSYDSGSGNGPFGFGWSLSLPAIARKTDKGLPRYQDAIESDVFVLSGAEDLVPVLVDDGSGNWVEPAVPPRDGYRIKSYRPRIEGLFARIERWTRESDGDTYWRSISRDNVTTYYGKTNESRIANPDDRTQVFSWLICQTQDDRGNVVLYSYAAEDSSNIDLSQPDERNRSAPGRRAANRYLKRIRYGNTQSLLVEGDVGKLSWLFEIVLDYGEGYLEIAAPDASGRIFASVTPTPAGTWPARQDPFSQYRACFEIRAYRLCRRILMFHHFPDELGTADCLVRSTDFDYKEGPVASFIAAVSQSGYTRQQDGRYLRKSLPKLELTYTEVQVDETVHDIDARSLENLPFGADGAAYQWIDLDGEGLNGVLSEQAESWFYKRNLGDGTFGPIARVAPKPSLTALNGRQHLLDLSGEGRLDLVQYDGPLAGFNARAADGGWEGLRPFKSLPNINTSNPNLRFVDVTGDGWPDILISEDRVFSWYESLAKDGFAPERRAQKSWDEESGPALLFADSTQSIFLADMVGDGLSDIVRIRYSEVCYWPNLGYGRFGAKITMGQAPVFESAELFDPRRLHLADIDGSGNADIIYAGHDGIALYFNQSGNFWSAPRRLAHFPDVDSLTAITATDLKGNGTACLVWSSPRASDARRPMRYIDLMGGQKPHLLVHTKNNMGAETEVQYAASTKFYLQDRLDGRAWVTKLPFPVHVIERVESRDLVSATKLVSSYRYRHGYYDGVEREFRGFAYVEQRDAEQVVGAFDLPPIVTKTWFHNGALLEDLTLEAYFKDPANREFFTGDAKAVFLADTDLPDKLTADETREAARALKGSVLRREIYADDGSAKAGLPYSVSEQNYTLNRLQGTGPNRHAVFFNHPRENLDYRYERNPDDPRISHAVTLTVDGYGNVLRSATIGYQRRAPAFTEQGVTLATLTESTYTPKIEQDDDYRTPVPCETKTYELTAALLTGAATLDFTVVEAAAATAAEIAYEVLPTAGMTQKRLIGRMRTRYRRSDLTDLLPFGVADSMALPGESYRLALTPGLLDIFQPKATPAALTAILVGPDARYQDLDSDGHFWIPSGQVFYSPTPGDPAVAELAFAQAHFFLPHRFQDPFGSITAVDYDLKYTLALVSTADAVGNQMLAEPDYRVLQPRTVTDQNGNRAEARFDALGMLSGVALLGKATGPIEGDSFADFETDLAPAEIAAYFAAADPRPLAIAHLGTATSRIIYNLEHVPVCAGSMAREIHVADLEAGQQTKAQLRFVYSDGFGREAQSKVQAEPGPLDPGVAGSPILNPRWIGTGAKTYNNKGKPIRQYEPFFSATATFGIETSGVSSTVFYDSLERVVATLRPDYTFEKIVFDPWRQTSFDSNDTVTFDPKTDPDAGEFFSRLPDSDYLPTWYQQRVGGALGPEEQAAAIKAAQHADTPGLGYFDGMGRTFLTVVSNGKNIHGAPQLYSTRTMLDIEGNPRQITDALDRVIVRFEYDLLGTRLHQTSMEAGEQWMLNDITGKQIRSWNSRGYAFRNGYDALRRPSRSFVQGGDAAELNAQLFLTEILFEQTIYGDSGETGLTEALQRQVNLRGKVFRHYDGAGIATTDHYDFKGNPLVSARQFVQFSGGLKARPDWSKNPVLENKIFLSVTEYDALNRATTAIAPDGSIYRPTFNEANLLAAVDVNMRGAEQSGKPIWTPFVTNVNYNAKGNRTRIEYGNGATTTYSYDPHRFRLVRLQTTRQPGQNGVSAKIFVDPTILQDLHYTYDTVANIVRIEDAALLTVFNGGQKVDASCDYTYDALYRLITAAGREHVGQSAFGFTPPDGNDRDYPFNGATQQSDLQALRNYTERYSYDPVGNFNNIVHNAVNGNWTRTYTYGESSLIEPTKVSNRLSQTVLQTSPAAPAEPCSYDAHGNIARMSHLSLMQWSFKDELNATSRQVVAVGAPETTYYLYDSSGHRARKRTERQNGTCKNERFYIGGFEIYREFDGNGAIVLERQTLHVLDDKQRIALVETQTVDHAETAASPTPARRYQLGNHLGSASLELDAVAALISYEEYSPYGNSTYQAGRSAAEISLKRYRYTGQERDGENGLAYHGARYYAPWLGRWTSCDPLGLIDGPNVFAYTNNNPVGKLDPTGTTGANDYGGTLPDGGLPAPDTTSYLPPPKDDPPPPAETAAAAAPPPPSSAPSPPPPRPSAPARRPTNEQLRESVPIASFFIRIPLPYVRSYQAPPEGAPVGLAAIRQLNGQPSVGVANFSRDIAPGTSVENLTLQTVSAINAGVGVLAPLARLPTQAAPAVVALENAAAAEARFNIIVQDAKPVVVFPNSADLPVVSASAAAEPALAELPAAVGTKTVATTPGGPSTLSGWGPASQVAGHNEAPAVSVYQFSRETGLTLKPHIFDFAGTPGSYGASHAERQALFLNPAANFVEVSKAPCGGCVSWISDLATLRNEPIVVYATNKGFWWFFPGGAIVH